MILQQRALANLEIRGSEYPPPPEKQRMAQVAFYVQMGFFALVFAGEQICGALKVPVPSILVSARENTMMSFMMIWLVGNVVQGSLLNTGAFEIHHGDQLIWSSLEHKRLPNMKDLIDAFAKTGVEFMPFQAQPEG